MLNSERSLAVFTTEPSLLAGLPRRKCLKYFSEGSPASMPECRYVFVLTSLPHLQQTAEFARLANQRHHLRALFVHTDDDAELLPQFLAQANLRAIRNMFVHRHIDVPRRVLNAFCIGAEDDLVATARLTEDELVVVSCASEMIRVPIKQVPALRRLSRAERGQFAIAEDGSYLHWPQPDVHLGLEDLRLVVDPRLKEQVFARRALEDGRIGNAIRRLRRTHGMTQGSIVGLSERQVRRIEKGQGTTVSALRRLASSHAMNLGDYVNELARISAELRRDDSGAERKSS